MVIRTGARNPKIINGLSLCSGFGGLELGLLIAEPGYRSVCYVERESSAASSLVARMADQTLDSAPIWDDVKTFDGRCWRNKVHLITGGYPCQPFSFAGRRADEKDPRHLWPDIARIVDEVRPDAVFFENVKGHLNLGFSNVARSLQGMGFKVKAGVFSAAETGAGHLRERLFILGYTDRIHEWQHSGVLAGRRQMEKQNASGLFRQTNRSNKPGGVVDVYAGISKSLRRMAGRTGRQYPPIFAPAPDQFSEWQKVLDIDPTLQPALPRTADGLSDWMERCTGAGNGVAPLAAARAWTTLLGDVYRQ